MLRPQSARSRFRFGRHPHRPPPSIVNRRGAYQKATNHRTITENLNKEQNGAVKATTNTNTINNTVMCQQSNEVQSYEKRPVRLWKWNHVKGSSSLADFQTYTFPVPSKSEGSVIKRASESNPV